MIRAQRDQAQELQNRADQAFGLTQCQPEHRPECQRRLDGQNRIAGLTASGRTGLGTPGCDRFFGEPHRQASALAQGSIVLRPVRHPVPLLGDVMTAGGIGLEGHKRDLCSDTRQASTLPRPGYQTPSMQQGGGRYYADPLRIGSQHYYLCSQWEVRHRSQFDTWLAGRLNGVQKDAAPDYP